MLKFDLLSQLAATRQILLLAEELGFEKPSDLAADEQRLTKELKRMAYDEAVRRQTLAAARVEQLKTTDQKRADAVAEKARLDAEVEKLRTVTL